MEKNSKKPLHYELLQANEHHFNKLQAGYRKIASGWLLAVFAGVGFVLKDLPDSWGGMTFLFIGLIFLAGAIGIFLLSIIDLQVYHPLIIANTTVGIELEEKFELLPPIHKKMEELKIGKVRSKSLLFYKVPVLLFMFLTTICLGIYFSTSGLFALSGSSLVLLGLTYWINNEMKV